MPWLDFCLERNPIKRIGPPAYGPLIDFIVARITGRMTGADGHDAAKPDMLDGFIAAQTENPVETRDNALMVYVSANVAAGSDTVAAELRSIVYYLCKNPRAMKKLQTELDAAGVAGTISWAKCQELPYLCACVSEGFRVLPGVGLPLERRVGPGGLALSDGKTVLPPGTMVGMNPYVVHRDLEVYGQDANSFRPERWLRDPSAPAGAEDERLLRMRESDLNFGSGKRVCTGRNIALIECHKIIGSLFSEFDVELVRPEREWKTHNAWLMRQSDMDVKLQRRLR